MKLGNSKTTENLLKAFAGECQARSRYEFGAKIARKEGLPLIEDTFKFIASQEVSHSKIFYRYLSEFSGSQITINNASYPVDLYGSTLEYLKASHKNEMEEHDTIYRDYADTAKEEGFIEIYDSFNMIAEIEKTHAEKFIKIHDQLSSGNLFKKTEKVKWFCTNCGYIHEGEEAPEVCPVCDHPKGYYVPFNEYF